MNCCDEYGQCRQGRDCPARTGIVLPHQAAHAASVAKIKASKPRTCDELGVCQGRGDCDCDCQDTVPPEAGNFPITYLGPDDDGDPLTRDECTALAQTLLAWLLIVLGIALLGTWIADVLSIWFGAV